MRADFFVHPDFFNRVRGRAPGEVIAEFYTDYLKEIVEKMLSAESGLLAYLPHEGDRNNPNTDPKYIELFSRPGRCKIPTECGTGWPYDTDASEALAEHLAKLSPDLLVIHGSYAPACVRDFIHEVKSNFSGRIALGTVLLRDFGDSRFVPHDLLAHTYPSLENFIDPFATKAYSVSPS